MEDVQCQPEATRLALVWTVPTGDVDTCLVVVEQLAAGGATQLVFRVNTSGGALLLVLLLGLLHFRSILYHRGNPYIEIYRYIWCVHVYLHDYAT